MGECHKTCVFYEFQGRILGEEGESKEGRERAEREGRMEWGGEGRDREEREEREVSAFIYILNLIKKHICPKERDTNKYICSTWFYWPYICFKRCYVDQMQLS